VSRNHSSVGPGSFVDDLSEVVKAKTKQIKKNEKNYYYFELFYEGNKRRPHEFCFSSIKRKKFSLQVIV